MKGWIGTIIWKRLSGWMLAALLLLNASCGVNHSSEGETDAAGLLRQAAERAKGAERFGLRMKLEQQLTFQEGSENYKLLSDGRVELKPLVMEQLIKSTTDGETSELRTILTEEGYFMEDRTSGEGWGRLPAGQIGSVRETLSDYQIGLPAQLKRIADYAEEGFSVTKESGKQVLIFDRMGTSVMSRVLLEDLLESTLSGALLEEQGKESVQIGKLLYRIIIDPRSGLPESIHTETAFTIALEPGELLGMQQTFALQYNKWNETAPIVVPDEALKAPEIEMPDQEQLEEWEELERQLQEEAGLP